MSDPQENTTVVGQAEATEMQAITSLQTREQELTFRCGQMFREVLSVAMQAGETHHALQNVMHGIRERLNIPKESLFRLAYDGNVYLVQPKEEPAPAAPPVEAEEEKATEES